MDSLNCPGMNEEAYLDSSRPPSVKVEKPWGRFEQYTHNVPSTVKIITVVPGGVLSSQYHHKREGRPRRGGPLPPPRGEALHTQGDGAQALVRGGARGEDLGGLLRALRRGGHRPPRRPLRPRRTVKLTGSAAAPGLVVGPTFVHAPQEHAPARNASPSPRSMTSSYSSRVPLIDSSRAYTRQRSAVGRGPSRSWSARRATPESRNS
jgi:hypothetical protein